MIAITKQRYPKLSASDLFYETIKLVSPVITADGSQNMPAHNTGGAIAVEIIDEHGLLVDMGIAAKNWQIVAPELCMTHCKD